MNPVVERQIHWLLNALWDGRQAIKAIKPTSSAPVEYWPFMAVSCARRALSIGNLPRVARELFKIANGQADVLNEYDDREDYRTLAVEIAAIIARRKAARKRCNAPKSPRNPKPDPTPGRCAECGSEMPDAKPRQLYCNARCANRSLAWTRRNRPKEYAKAKGRHVATFQRGYCHERKGPEVEVREVTG